MDQITKNFLTSYCEQVGLDTDDEAYAFEHFAIHLAISHVFPDSPDTESLHIGGEGNPGVDGIGIVVNGILVTSHEDAEHICEKARTLEVDFVFVQAKRSSKFNSGDVGNFAHGVRDFFAETPSLAWNLQTQDAIQVKDVVYKHSAKMHVRLPSLYLFYVTTGSQQDHNDLTARAQSETDAFSALNLFQNDAIKLLLWGSDNIRKQHQRNQQSVEAQLVFENRQTLKGDIPGVDEAHIGFVPALNLVSLISDSSGNIRRSVFFDNVRDFQGENTVNSGMQGTLDDEATRSRFAIMNNGVTIVAESSILTGNTFDLRDFQVVNGCQTCHVLHRSRATLDDSVSVPVRLVVTGSKEVSTSIIRATNRQTSVKEGQLYATDEFQKKLEAYYGTFAGTQRLSYERRSRQFASDSSVEKIRVRTPAQQLSAFAAIFMEEPHRGHYTKTLDDRVGETIFVEKHQLSPYFASAYSLFRLDQMFRSHTIDRVLKPARYHILLVASRQWTDKVRPSIEAKGAEAYWRQYVDFLDDDNQAANLFTQAAEFVLEAAGDRVLDRSLSKRQSFTEEIVSKLRGQPST